MPTSAFVRQFGVAKTHLKKRKGYPRRTPVSEPDTTKPCPGYAPKFYEDPILEEAEWADRNPADIDWSERTSHDGPLDFSLDGLPRNPNGRTGLVGRGVLGKWGVNHAADPVLIRGFSGCSRGDVLLVTRKDNGKLAFPGGFVDPGENPATAALRELREEALDGTPPEQLDAALEDADKKKVVFYQGYVDDDRNTDAAWIETTAFLIKVDDKLSCLLGAPTGGDDALSAHWATIDDSLFDCMHASHGDMLKQAIALYDVLEETGDLYR
tara:strand:- start:628 stop:1431 length:804 start_codon:yes stop_codon:yes gene_type:complete